MHEIILNLHIHTPYSDGQGSHGEIAQAALEAGIDAMIVTDHNVWVNGPEGYYQDRDKRALMLVGEEIHDQARQPQKNHLLVFGADRELAALAHNPQHLLDGIKEAGGVAFIAHPIDPENKRFNEPDLSWVDWEVNGYTGIELWNAMSEFKTKLKSKLHALFYAFNPRYIASGPFPETLARWDELLKGGHKVAAIGGSDAHALIGRMGPLRRTLFPYEFHFRCVNTHLLIPEPLNGELTRDKALILDAFRQGHAFVGYDLPAPTRGFRFTAQGTNKTVSMGDDVPARGGVTLQIRLPRWAECILIKDGDPIKTWNNRDICTHVTAKPGVYRAEVYIQYLRRRRGWIFSNPIYVRG
ncbi:MAG: CehA/McbA family metallohydrolase [Anaerolineales bacterium]